MALRVRTFRIHDESAVDDEALLDQFLRSVDVDRVDTAAANDGWRVAVLFHDQREKEEAEQIASVVAGALKAWRSNCAEAAGEPPIVILSDDALDLIARCIPTTTLELRAMLGEEDAVATTHAHEIVQVVRNTMDALA